MAILQIDRWASKCLNCDRGADPREKFHTTALGYGIDSDDRGCGAEFTEVTSSYISPVMKEHIEDMRPDLLFVDYLEVVEEKKHGA